jgi:hypothetical protein
MGSEELWSQTEIRLIAEGVPVAASVRGRGNIEVLRKILSVPANIRLQCST